MERFIVMYTLELKLYTTYIFVEHYVTFRGMLNSYVSIGT